MIILLLYSSRYYYYACPEWRRRLRATVGRNGKIINTSLAGLYKSHHITPPCTCIVVLRVINPFVVGPLRVNTYITWTYICERVLCVRARTWGLIRPNEWRRNRRRPELRTPVVNYYKATKAMVPTTRPIYKCSMDKKWVVWKKIHIFVVFIHNLYAIYFDGNREDPSIDVKATFNILLDNSELINTFLNLL